jgi:putative transcriptional regulator
MIFYFQGESIPRQCCGHKARLISSRLKKSRSVGSEIVEALQNAVAYAKGDQSKGRPRQILVLPPVDVKQVRRKLGLSQSAFAETFGINAATLRNWEQGRRQPEGPARVLLTIIDREPAAVQRVLMAR